MRAWLLWISGTLASCSSSAPMPPPSPPPAGVPVFGTAHPLLVKRAASDGRWLVWCEAREDTDHNGRIEVRGDEHGNLYGDVMRPFFAAGGGEGEAIDAFVDADESGRYIALVRNQHLELRDTQEGTTADLSLLGGIPDGDDNPFGGHPAGAFDEEGKRFVYRRQDGSRRIAVVRDLADGKEATVDPGDGLLWRAYIDGEWVVMSVIARDTDGNGRLEPPVPMSDVKGQGTCHASPAAYFVAGRAG